MPFILTGVIGSVIVIVNAVFATVATYRASPVFLIPLIWGPYLLRKKLALLPSHYALFVSAALLHDLGAYGFYQKWPLPFSFDIAVHFYFAFVAAFAVHRVIEARMLLRRWQVELFTVMFMMGLGALHEVMEYGSYLLLGEKGMLKTGSYMFDTNRDLTNNLLGTLLAMTIMVVHRRVNRQDAKTPRRTENAKLQR